MIKNPYLLLPSLPLPEYISFRNIASHLYFSLHSIGLSYSIFLSPILRLFIYVFLSLRQHSDESPKFILQIPHRWSVWRLGQTANHNPPQVSIGVMIGRSNNTLFSWPTNAIAPGGNNAKHTQISRQLIALDRYDRRNYGPNDLRLSTPTTSSNNAKEAIKQKIIRTPNRCPAP